MSLFALSTTLTNYSLRFLRFLQLLFVRVPLSNLSCLKLKRVWAEGKVVRKQRTFPGPPHPLPHHSLVSLLLNNSTLAFVYFLLTLSEKSLFILGQLMDKGWIMVYNHPSETRGLVRLPLLRASTPIQLSWNDQL